ncbi:MAG: PQQ-binding-like beta-propeller repeat protein [Bacteroidales bacterium]
MFRKSIFITLSVLLHIPLVVGNNPASDWPQFRGSLRNGSSPVSPQAVEWPENGPKLIWKQDIGSGFSEVLVSGSELFTMFAEKTDSITGWEYLAAYDAQTGEELWRAQLDSVFIDVDNWGDGPRSTPFLDQDHLYCFTGFGKLMSVSRDNGAIGWSVDFIEAFGSTLPRWGYSSSPVVMGNLVMIETGGDQDRAFAAFNKHTGELVWAAGTGPAMYSSAIIAEIGGQTQIIHPNGRNLFSFDENGDSLWTYTMPIGSPMASPLFIPPDKIFVSANNGVGGFMVKVTGQVVEEVFNTSAMKNDWSSSVYHDGHIYGFHLASLQCISVEDGKRLWGKRGLGKGSLILIGDKLLALSDLGVLTMLEASPQGYIEMGSVEAIEGRSWTAPSYANGRIYVRNHTQMACFEL